MKKYRLTDKSRTYKGHTLYQIESLKHGGLGGWVESENNLSQEDGCWIYEDSIVYGKARVEDNSVVCNGHKRNKAGNKNKAVIAIVGGNSLIQGGSIIEGAKILGNSIIFDNSFICGCTVKNAYIGRDSYIGPLSDYVTYKPLVKGHPMITRIPGISPLYSMGPKVFSGSLHEFEIYVNQKFTGKDLKKYKTFITLEKMI